MHIILNVHLFIPSIFDYTLYIRNYIKKIIDFTQQAIRFVLITAFSIKCNYLMLNSQINYFITISWY